MKADRTSRILQQTLQLREALINGKVFEGGSGGRKRDEGNTAGRSEEGEKGREEVRK